MPTQLSIRLPSNELPLFIVPSVPSWLYLQSSHNKKEVLPMLYITRASVDFHPHRRFVLPSYRVDSDGSGNNGILQEVLPPCVSIRIGRQCLNK